MATTKAKTPTTPAVCRGGMGRAAWLSQQNGRKAVLYLIRLTGNGETFYKVGITFCFSARVAARKIPYTVRTFARYSSYNAGKVYDLEQRLHRAGFAAYVPLLAFSGKGECYSEVRPLLAALPASTFVLKHVTRELL